MTIKELDNLYMEARAALLKRIKSQSGDYEGAASALECLTRAYMNDRSMNTQMVVSLDAALVEEEK